MTVQELYKLRERFWKMDKQQYGIFGQIASTGVVPNAAPELLDGVNYFLRLVKETTTDEELKKDVERYQEMIDAKTISPFGSM